MSRWGFVIFGLLCLGWLVTRSGRKPSRLRYPCQQVAAAHCAWVVPALGAWFARSITRPLLRRFLVTSLFAATVAFMITGLGADLPAGVSKSEIPDIHKAASRANDLEPRAWSGASASGEHDVFVVSNMPQPEPDSLEHAGVETMIHLLAQQGIHLYRSETNRSFCAAPDGIIEPDDVVLLKVNAAFDQRGMTNTDVVKGMITALLQHPDGFSGEVVIVENCEGGPDYDQTYNNAQNVYQNFDAVVGYFGDEDRVCSSSWWSFTDNMVTEFENGDYRQGYVWVGNNVSYPKFVTGRGTCVSLLKGIWTGSGYDSSRVKMINMPVLKSHNATGVTACMKNFMGVPSIHRTTDVHTDLIFYGFMGRMMNQVIYPDLHVLDATWISPSHPTGPAGPYSLAVRTDMLLAGIDPVAVDYYAGKHVLFPVSGYGRHDPDTPYNESTNPYHDGTSNTGYPYNAFRIMINTTAGELLRGGHDVSADPSLMRVFTRDASEGKGLPGGHTVCGVSEPASRWYFAEGSTREGFEEYLCLENPQTDTAACDVTFMCEEGEATAIQISVEPQSRKTMHVNEVLGPGKDVSCSISSDTPVVAERPMYFSCGGVSGGHTVVGTTETSPTWYFAEGYTGEGFEEYVTVLNPNDAPADLAFRFHTEEEGELLREGLAVPPLSRATFKVNELLGSGYNASLELESDLPVVAERPMYFDYLGRADVHWSGGHCVAGATELSSEYYFAEGTTLVGFEEWLTVQNPHREAIGVFVTYHFGAGGGEPLQRSYVIEGKSRRTIYVPQEVGLDREVSISVRSDDTFLAERPMYFRYRDSGANWTGGHCVIGAGRASRSLHFAEGFTGEGFQEWLCLLNPSDSLSTVTIDYFTGQGERPPSTTVQIAPESRLTLKVNDYVGSCRQVSCRLRVEDGPPVVAERPMYFDFW